MPSKKSVQAVPKAASVSFYQQQQQDDKDFVLVVNRGSSSLKAALFAMRQEQLIRLLDADFKAIKAVEVDLCVGIAQGIKQKALHGPLAIEDAVEAVFDLLKRHFDIDPQKLYAIGHRFVHGGSKYRTSVCLTDNVLADLEQLTPLAPLHNTASLEGIKACLKFCGDVPQIIAFDTAFHSALPAVAANYALPSSLAAKHGIQRYGFHGFAHAFLWRRYAAQCNSESCLDKIITIHLGSGCSMAAIAGGRSVDTSMGFTPDEGLVMATRAGDIDAAVVPFLCQQEGITPSSAVEILNMQSGLWGISAVSADMHTLLELYAQNGMVGLAVDMFCYRILKYIGAYIAVLEGVDAIIFSGGIGENAPTIRKNIIKKMHWYGLQMDDTANEQAVGMRPGAICKISTSASNVALYVIAADENFEIAEEVYVRLKQNKKA